MLYYLTVKGETILLEVLIIGMMVDNVQGVSLLIVHIDVFLLNFTQFVRWEGGQHIPTQVQGFPDRSVITGTLKFLAFSQVTCLTNLCSNLSKNSR
jgi:hypothetical protein